MTTNEPTPPPGTDGEILTPPPTDWRKLVEELVKIIQDLADKGELYPNEEAIFTRAKAALEVKP